MVVSDNGASAEGGVTGTTNEARFFNNVPGTVDDDLKVIDELGGPKHFNHYPWGLFAGQTLRSVGGSERPTGAARATCS